MPSASKGIMIVIVYGEPVEFANFIKRDPLNSPPPLSSEIGTNHNHLLDSIRFWLSQGTVEHMNSIYDAYFLRKNKIFG